MVLIKTLVDKLNPANRIKIWHIIILAVVVRLSYVAIAPPRPVGWDDAGSWDAVGWNLASGKGFLESDGSPTQQRPPVYPIFLALVYLIFGHSQFLAKIFQCVADGATVFFIFLIARRMYGEKIALAAALALAFYPPLIVYNGIIASEIIFTLCLAVATFFLIFAEENSGAPRSYRLWALAGLFFGIAALARSTSVFYPIFYLVLRLFFSGGKKLLKQFLVFFVIYVATLVPWSMRNYYVFGKFTPMAAGGGGLFWAATVEDFGGGPAPYGMGHYYEEVRNDSLINQDAMGLKAAIGNVIKSPSRYARLTLKRFMLTISQPVGKVLVSRKSHAMGCLMSVVYTMMSLAGFIGLFFSLRSFPIGRILPSASLFIYFILINSLVASIPRYRLPSEPIIMCFAVYGIYGLLARRQKEMNA